MKALSIMQPWAWLIVNGHKNIENRSWSTKFRGPVLIHAGRAEDVEASHDLQSGRHPVTGEVQPVMDREWKRGGIVGYAEIDDCVSDSDSEWFVGKFGFVMINARPLAFQPMRGQLGFFDVPHEIMLAALWGDR
jgi:hypothetical protein